MLNPHWCMLAIDDFDKGAEPERASKPEYRYASGVGIYALLGIPRGDGVRENEYSCGAGKGDGSPC